MSSRDIFRPVMVFLRLCGCHPKKTCSITRILSYLGTGLNIFWAIFILIKLVNERNGMAEAANSFVNFLITTHVFSSCTSQDHSKRAFCRSSSNPYACNSTRTPSQASSIQSTRNSGQRTKYPAKLPISTNSTKLSYV